MDSFQHYDRGFKACSAAFHQARADNDGVIKSCFKGLLAFFAGYDVQSRSDVESLIPDFSSQSRLEGDLNQRSADVIVSPERRMDESPPYHNESPRGFLKRNDSMGSNDSGYIEGSDQDLIGQEKEQDPAIDDRVDHKQDEIDSKIRKK